MSWHGTVGPCCIVMPTLFILVCWHSTRRCSQINYTANYNKHPKVFSLKIMLTSQKVHTRSFGLASFPGPAQLFVAISAEKRERAWYFFSREWRQDRKDGRKSLIVRGCIQEKKHLFATISFKRGVFLRVGLFSGDCGYLRIWYQLPISSYLHS